MLLLDNRSVSLAILGTALQVTPILAPLLPLFPATALGAPKGSIALVFIAFQLHFRLETQVLLLDGRTVKYMLLMVRTLSSVTEAIYYTAEVMNDLATSQTILLTAGTMAF